MGFIFDEKKKRSNISLRLRNYNFKNYIGKEKIEKRVNESTESEDLLKLKTTK